MEIGSELGTVGFQILRNAGHSYHPGNEAVRNDDKYEKLGSLDDDGTSTVEIVLETSAEDARRIRQMFSVKHIAQRKACQGRVRFTVDVKAALIDDVTQFADLWARADVTAESSVLLYQSEAQWEQVGGILMKENWLGGHGIYESPR